MLPLLRKQHSFQHAWRSCWLPCSCLRMAGLISLVSVNHCNRARLFVACPEKEVKPSRLHRSPVADGQRGEWEL
eukprot:362493-Pelagomonas_calceolata.AAC.3